MVKAGENRFTTRVEWTGNTGAGTATYEGYTRDWQIAVPGKPVIPCSNDPELGGNPALMNPEVSATPTPAGGSWPAPGGPPSPPPQAAMHAAAVTRLNGPNTRRPSVVGFRMVQASCDC